MEKLKIKFPDENEYDFEFGQPIVLLGANGAGKTRLSIKIEEINDPSFQNSRAKETIYIHRISAQKSLAIKEKISIEDYESANKMLYIGSTEEYSTKKAYRFSRNPATALLNDFNSALSLLFSEENLQLQKEHEANRQAEKNNEDRPPLITTITEKATEIWNDLLPHRKIDLSGNNVHALCNDTKYHGKEMSDGERVILYMICQVLVQRKNTLLIIDEPELHIHKSIVKKLWSRLEMERNDCIFMYITHDLEFAQSRNNAKILWVKSYDGKNWDYEFLESCEYENIPESLLYEIIGSRQKILFVEGTDSSYDKTLYEELYEDKGYHIISCNSCEDVKKCVKASKTYKKLSALKAVGIIDRDYRDEKEIESLKKDGIFTLQVAEIENLFLISKVIEIAGEALACEKKEIDDAKKIIAEIFKKAKESQIAKALKSEISYQLSTLDFGKPSTNAIKILEEINKNITKSFIEERKAYVEEKFNCTDIDEILKVFNKKDLSFEVEKKLGLGRNTYKSKVINMIKQNVGGKRNEILDAIRPYVPDLE